MYCCILDEILELKKEVKLQLRKCDMYVCTLLTIKYQSGSLIVGNKIVRIRSNINVNHGETKYEVYGSPLYHLLEVNFSRSQQLFKIKNFIIKSLRKHQDHKSDLGGPKNMLS